MSSTNTAVSEAQSPAAIARRLYEITASGDLDTLQTILAPNVIDHGVGGEDISGAAAVQASLEAFRAAFPDLVFTIEDVIESGEKVAVRWTAKATHRDTFQGIPATGRTIHMTGTDILRVADGKVIERWGNSDELGLLQQLVDRRTGDRRSRTGAPAAPADRRRGPDRRRG